MTRTLLLALSLIFSTGVLADVDGGGYGYRRAQADSHPTTMKARREFDARTKQLFAESKRRNHLPALKLTMNQRMIAQYGRGAASANAVLPVELDHLVKFISEARHNRAGIVREILSARTFSQANRGDIEKAVDQLAQIRTIHLDYWGYIGRTERYPEFNPSNKTISFFAKWNERASRYELYTERALRIHVIKGIVASLNKKDSTWWPL